MGHRVFLVHDDDTLRRVSQAQIARLRHDGADERLPEYAGQRVRYALLFVETEARRPVDVVHEEFGYLYFAEDGRLDFERQNRGAALAMRATGLLSDESGPEGVVGAGERFAKKRYQHEFKWEPTPEIREAIRKAIFGARIYHL
jgi:hypothetical protein